MTGFGIALEAFHFLRPLWLLTVLALLILWIAVRRAQTRRDPAPEGLAPHLRKALTIGEAAGRRILPIDGVILTLVLLALGAAGPTWSRQPDPFMAQSAPLVVALKVTPSMEELDVAPSRLERGKQKVRDLLDLRAGARTALVAYAGTAHSVVPMTEDPGVMVPYLEGLSPDIMPSEGNRGADALTLALDLLAREDMPGGVLFVTDTINPGDVAALNEAEVSVAVLEMLPVGQDDPGIDQLSVAVERVTPDDGDIRAVDRMLAAAYRQALLEDNDQPWQDRGPWLAWPAALLTLLWFRRGWTMRWAVITALALVWQPQTARADGIADWFLTADQQGRLAYQRKDYSRAAELFEDPLWRGYAQYKAGQYADAVETLSRVETAEAAFTQGIAAIRNRAYRDGARAFETALSRDPEYPGAAENLVLTQQIIEYVESAREQSDTGEDSGIGADDVVFDNEAARGAETQMEAAQEDGAGLLTADQWMNTVDTRTGDFLRQRFALEASQAARQGGEE
ncbi:MAG: VWA domain-containing protein [Paracoccaceae bacterium]